MELWRDYAEFDVKDFSSEKECIDTLTTKVLNDGRIKRLVRNEQASFELILPGNIFKTYLSCDNRGMFVGVETAVGPNKTRSEEGILGYVHHSLQRAQEGSYGFFKRVVNSIYNLEKEQSHLRKVV